MQAVILAGGLGTRLAPFTLTNPKPMYPINGKPFLRYLVEQIRGFGITDILMLLGYLPEKVMDYFGNGYELGVRIRYCVTPTDYETGARIYNAKDELEDEFLLLYCDNYCPVDYRSMLEQFRQSQALIQITAYSNDDNYTKSNLIIGENGCVSVYDKGRTKAGLEKVDIGYALIKKEALSKLPQGNVNFEVSVYPKLTEAGDLYAFVTEHRYYSIGSWARIEMTKCFFSGQKAIFLDRDGTINVRPPKACYVEKVEDFVWLDGAIEAVRILKENGYMVFLITNQPGIARGKLTLEALEKIHQKMQCDLKKIGCQIDRIYFCPHNWEEGCECRKPNTGMLYQAQKDFDLNIPRDCILIGDDERDIEAANRAFCRSVLVTDSYTILDAVKNLIANNQLLKGEN